MEINNFKEKRVWAVVGSVHNKEKFAYKIFKVLKSKGYEVYPVDPSGISVDEEVTYKTLKDLPIIPEAVDMVINPIKGMGFVDEASSLGVKFIWFQPGAENDEIVKKAEGYGMNVIYKKCVMVEF